MTLRTASACGRPSLKTQPTAHPAGRSGGLRLAGQARGRCVTVSTLALAVTLAGSRQLNAGSATQSLMLLPALPGMWLGQRLRDELSQAAFPQFLHGRFAAARLVRQGL